MKFLVDAHLPPQLCAILTQHGHDAVHTLDLPAKNATKDRVINQLSLADQRVVISKDTDFFYTAKGNNLSKIFTTKRQRNKGPKRLNL